MMDPLWPIVSGGIAVTIVLIGVLLVWRIVKDRRSGFPSGDERTQRITGKAATHALMIGQYSTIALLALNFVNQEFYGSPALDWGYTLIASLLAYSLSFLGLRFYFNRKGDF